MPIQFSKIAESCLAGLPVGFTCSLEMNDTGGIYNTLLAKQAMT